MTTRRVVYVRHAEKTHGNNDNNFIGKRFDPALTPKGFSEIENSRDEIYKLLTENHKFKYVICSPFLRCHLTMKGLRLSDETELIYNPDLREYLGNQSKRLERVMKQTKKTEFQIIKDYLTNETYYYLKPDFELAFEKIEGLTNRAQKVQKEILEMINPGESILIVSHGIVIDKMIENHKFIQLDNILLECKMMEL